MLYPFDLSGPEFLLLYINLIAAATLVSLGVWFSVASCSIAMPVICLDAYETAYLAGGSKRVALALTAATIDLKLATAVRRFTALEFSPPIMPNADPMLKHLTDCGERVLPLRRIGSVIADDLKQLRHTLQTQSLLISDEGLLLSRAVSLLLLGGTLTIGVIKVGVGISRDRSVDYLLMLCLVVVALLIALLRMPFRTWAGWRFQRKLRAQRPRPSQTADVHDTVLVALWGLSILRNHSDYDVFHAAFSSFRAPYGDSWNSGNGSGGGCSAGGCGGGHGCGGGGHGCGGHGCGGCGGGGH